MTTWHPDLGDEVWWNHPDSGRIGEVIGFVTDELPHRKGQPIIAKDGGEKVVVHPQFLLPFEFGGDDWKRARDDGRIDGLRGQRAARGGSSSE